MIIKYVWIEKQGAAGVRITPDIAINTTGFITHQRAIDISITPWRMMRNQNGYNPRRYMPEVLREAAAPGQTQIADLRLIPFTTFIKDKVLWLII
jgi:hypothetical protein